MSDARDMTGVSAASAHSVDAVRLRAGFAPSAPPAFGDFGAALADGFARRIGEIAARLGASAHSVQWVHRAAFAVSRATSAGHVCVPVARLARRYGEKPERARAALLASGVVSEGGAQGAASHPLVVDAAGRLYLSRYFDYECRLAEAILAHSAPVAPNEIPRPEGSPLGGRPEGSPLGGLGDWRIGGSVDWGTGGLDAPKSADTDASAHTEASALRARLARYFGPPCADDIDWQRAAAALALASRLTIVSGGPGTGKTTTVVGMLACLLDEAPELSIALAAPTGKAAQRMQEALSARAQTLPPAIAARLPRGAQTLHRLLGAGQRGARLRHHRDNPLPYDVLVVDEASMIDLAMAAQLFDALAPPTRLIMLGDKDQLAAVEAGAVFAELSARPAFSAQGIARVAGATGLDETRVKSSLAALSDRAQESVIAGSAGTPFHEDAFFSRADEIDFDGRIFDADVDADADADAAGAYAMPFPSDTGMMPIGRDGDPYSANHANEAGEANEINALQSATPLVDCVIWLERNYRFGLESPIGKLSMAIRRGDAGTALGALLTANGAAGPQAVAVLDEDAGTPLATRTVKSLAQGFAPYATALEAALAANEPDPGPLFEALNVFRILCATRVGARGVDALNALMAAHVRQVARVPLAPGASWFAGRPVMIARNDYALGLFNGDIGIALPGPGGAMRVYFRTADGGVRGVTPAALPPHDTAFALTVHKSQGSEFDEVALVLPAAMSRVLSRELVYTAVTRARAAVRIIGARAVLADAIATPTRRDSGLAARMIEALARKGSAR
jgi:exodeoxyribonuclease V alpha subunit